MLPVLVALIFLSFSSRKENSADRAAQPDEIHTLTWPQHLDFSVDTAQTSYSVLKKDYVGFKTAVGFKESQGKYHLVNPFGYMGKYQFGKVTLSALGIRSTEDFMNNPGLQEEAFYTFLARNKWILRKEISQYVGQTVGGVEITESGMLAAAHLAGPGGVKRYLRSGGVAGPSDAFGTNVRHYLKKFGGYDVSIVRARKNATVDMFFAYN